MTGAGTFLRMFLRRDRWGVLAWTIGITLLYYSQAVSIDALYTSQAELDKAAVAMGDNAALIAMAGPARALNTVGGQVVWQAAAFGAVLVGLMSMFLVGRHTRVEEESGREELLRAAPVGRFATVGAAAMVAAAANVVVGAAVAVSLAAYPLDVSDSIATGVGLTLTGWVFTAVALAAAQLTASARAMYGIVGAVLGLAYALRAVGDVGNPVLSWLSPIGWCQAMHPFSGLRWWPVLPLAGMTGLLLVAAYAVLVRRDLGSGVLAGRPGPARGQLSSGLALAWRLQRGAVLGWTAGLLLTGLAFGSIGDDVADLAGDSQTTRDLFAPGGSALVDGFYGTTLLMVGVLAAGFSVGSALRPRGEEEAGRTELLLATGLPRTRWLAGHALVTIGGSLATLVAGGLGVGLGFSLTTGDWGGMTHLSVPALAYVAPVLVCSAVALLLYAIVPRWAAAAWTLVGFAAVVMLFAEILGLSGWLRALSPFHHLALMPAETFGLAPVVGLLGLAAALGVVAEVTLSRRDMK